MSPGKRSSKGDVSRDLIMCTCNITLEILLSRYFATHVLSAAEPANVDTMYA